MTNRTIKNRSVVLDEPVVEEPRPRPARAARTPRQPRRTTRPVQLERVKQHPDEWVKVEICATKKLAQGAASWYRRGNGVYAIGVVDSIYQDEQDGSYSVFARFNTNKKKERI